jgi:beta-lactamase superfamily II metal-dependent hydrolase
MFQKRAIIAEFFIVYRNRYKFPNQDIISRYESRVIKLFDTAQHGAIIVKTGSPDMTITAYRQKAQRFWHTNFNN